MSDHLICKHDTSVSYCETCVYFEWVEYVGAKGMCTWGKRITKKQVVGNPAKYEYRRKCELFDAI